MVSLGDVLVWNTDQAIGYVQRRKFHVYIGRGDWRVEEKHVFFFVSKADYSGDYRITKPPYDWLDLDYSFVSCGEFPTYTAQEVRDAAARLVGRLSDQHLRELHDAIVESDTMPAKSKLIVCDMLRVAFAA